MNTGSHQTPREATQEVETAPTVSCSVNAAPDPDLTGDVDALAACTAHEAPVSRTEPPCVKKIRLFNQFIDQALAGLPPPAAVLWLTLFRFARGGTVVVGQKTLATRLGVDVKTVKRNLSLLYKLRLVRIRKRAVERKRVNEYQLGILPLPPRPKPDRRSKKASPGTPK